MAAATQQHKIELHGAVGDLTKRGGRDGYDGFVVIFKKKEPCYFRDITVKL